MADLIVAKKVGKRFRRYHVDAPGSIHEALMRGFGKLRPADVFWGLRGVDFRAAPGRMIGIVGRNGAGKSTLLRLIAGVGRPDEGRIEVNGRLQALISLGAGFHPELSGRDNLMINGVTGGLTRRTVLKKFDEIVAFAEVEDFIDSPLRIYSSGMRMRLAFAIAIHSSPEILLLDEVLAVGDVAFQAKCMRRINEIKASGCTIILVCHDPGTVQRLCDEAVWMRAGKVAAHGPAESVIAAYLKGSEVTLDELEGVGPMGARTNLVRGVDPSG
jgi:lipopolysaccharide transport system ATP-binding protein